MTMWPWISPSMYIGINHHPYMGVDQVQDMGREESRRKSLENATEKSIFLQRYTIMEVGKIIFLSFRDPNQNLHFHERTNYIVMMAIKPYISGKLR